MENGVWLLVSFVGGFVLAALLVPRFLAPRRKELEELRVKNQEAELRAAVKEKEADSAGVQLSGALDKLAAVEAELKEATLERTRLTSEVEAAKEHLRREREYIEASKKEQENTFQSLAAKALEGNNRQFVELAKSHLAKETETAKGELLQRQQAIAELVRPLKENLEQYAQQVQQLEKERQKSYTTVEGELKRVVEASIKLSEQTQGLKSALRKPHVRGRWGEVQLKTCLDLAGMSEYSDFDLQVSNDDKSLRPDLTVRMPGGRIVIVDAKTPIDAFLASLEATTDAERAEHMARHGQQVVDHVRNLAKKSYSEHFKDAADFTVMFLPNESFLYAALESQPNLVEIALEKKILVATPPTFIGLLKVIQFGWNEEKLAQNAQLVWDTGKELHKRVLDFFEGFTRIGDSLKKAVKEYDRGFNSLNSRVLTQVRRLEALGVKGSKSLPEEVGYVEELAPAAETEKATS